MTGKLPACAFRTCLPRCGAGTAQTGLNGRKYFYETDFSVSQNHTTVDIVWLFHKRR